jgi:hypothetical protein
VKPVTKFFLLFILPVFVLSGFSCVSRNAGGNSPSQGDLPQLPKAGVIHEKIQCSKNPELSYALYLPSTLSYRMQDTGYRIQRQKSGINQPSSIIRYPVILAFDPQGMGGLPVKMYRDLAEKYGFILIGSNDSRNGLPNDKISNILSAMLEEIDGRYPVDSGQFYTMGFSGGARVACLAAMNFPIVKSVIGCGAGFPQSEPSPLYRFDYFGMVGTADFNLNEMMELEGMLNITGLRHFIATFNGPHAWPPSNRMEDAFQWMILNAMKDNRIKKDERQINQIISTFKERIDTAKKANRLIEASSYCNEAIQFATGLTSTETFCNELRSIELLPEYKKQTDYHQNILKKESKEQQYLMDALFTKDLHWWNDRIKKLTASGAKTNPEDTLMNVRLKAFLSLICYSNVNAAMKQRNSDMAEKLIGVYQLADPMNPEPNYTHAVLLMQRDDTIQAMRQLQTSVSKGFSDKNRLLAQPEFEGLKNVPSFFDLVQKMK